MTNFLKEAEDSDPEDEDDYDEKVEAKINLENKDTSSDMSFISHDTNNKTSWIGEYKSEGAINYYNSCQVRIYYSIYIILNIKLY